MNWLNSTCIGGGMGFLLSNVLNMGKQESIVPFCIMASNIYGYFADDLTQTISLVQEKQVTKQIKVHKDIDQIDLICKLITTTMPIIGYSISESQVKYCVFGLLISSVIKTADMFTDNNNLKIQLPSEYILVEVTKSEDNLEIINYYDEFTLSM